MVSVDFFIGILILSHYGPGVDSASNRNEYQKYSVRRADNLTTFMCRLSRNLGASTSWNPQGLSRPVMGLLYLFFFYKTRIDELKYLSQIVTSLRNGILTNRVSISDMDRSLFCILKGSDLWWSPTVLFSGYRVLSLAIKWRWRDADPICIHPH
jgi:hypothetical protein